MYALLLIIIHDIIHNRHTAFIYSTLCQIKNNRKDADEVAQRLYKICNQVLRK